MLKELRIFNIILIECAEIIFKKGLNVITGETGSGKSAIMHSMNFIAGARGDTSLIRKGCDKGAVEAAFNIDKHQQIYGILESAGIDHDRENDLIIRREISESGKSRAYINNQMVQVSLLKTIGELLLGIVGQHANRHLQSTTHHRHIINLYGGLESSTAAFAASWSEENELREQHAELKNSETKRLREIEAYNRELQELDEADIKEGEDESLFAEYSLLTNSQEIAHKIETLLHGMSGDKQSILASLHRQKRFFEELTILLPNLKEAAEAHANALIELEEVASQLNGIQSRLEYNPERIHELNERLSLLNSLKRRYGSTLEEIQNYKTAVSAKLIKLENADATIEDLYKKIDLLSESNNLLAAALTEQRITAAGKFESAMVKHLRALNMPKVDFQVEITAQKRDRSGDDALEFFLLPNLGEHKVPLKGCASGGELSRVLLSLHTVIAGKEKTPTLVFDEIDANIGGETASVVGEKLKEIERKQQIICITHFPQVARQASSHLQISKGEKNGRTITSVKVLEDGSRQQELERMLGGAPVLASYAGY